MLKAYIILKVKEKINKSVVFEIFRLFYKKFIYIIFILFEWATKSL